VDFGASPAEAAALLLWEFWEMLHKPGPAVDSQATLDPNRVEAYYVYDSHYDKKGQPGHKPDKSVQLEGGAFKFVLENGNFPDPPTSTATSSTSPPVVPTVTTGATTSTTIATDPTSTGQGAKWFVKGGSFQFRINTDFAVSHATVTAGDDGDGAGVSVPDYGGKTPPTDTGIYSKPMQVSTGITSELSVTIRIKSSGHIVGGWTKGALDIKAVPTATFGPYDIATDPSRSSADTLLTATGGTMPLGMGLILSAPLPFLAKSLIPVFKASDAAVQAVTDFRYKPAGAVSGDDWFIPRLIPALNDLHATNVVIAPLQTTYLPAELTDQEQKESSQQRWDNIGQTWTGLAKDHASLVSDPTAGLLATIVKAFNWDAPVPNLSPPASASVSGTATGSPASPAGGVPTTATGTTSTSAPTMGGTAANGTSPTPAPVPAPAPQPWQLSGAFPAKMVRSFNKDGKVVKNLEATYLALPRMAVVNA
jgi:hypothetical protein